MIIVKIEDPKVRKELSSKFDYIENLERLLASRADFNLKRKAKKNHICFNFIEDEKHYSIKKPMKKTFDIDVTSAIIPKMFAEFSLTSFDKIIADVEKEITALS